MNQSTVSVWEVADNRPNFVGPLPLLPMAGAITGALVGAVASHTYLSDPWVLPGSVAGVLVGAWLLPALRMLAGSQAPPQAN